MIIIIYYYFAQLEIAFNMDTINQMNTIRPIKPIIVYLLHKIKGF